MKRLGLYLGILQLAIGAGAVPPGLSMIFQPDGSGLGMSVEMLEGTPFSNFLIPGLFLLIFNGLLHLIAAVLSIRKNKLASLWGILLGLFLIAWIVFQMYFLGLVHFLQPVYLFIGIVELSLSLRLYTKYSSSS